MNMRKLLPKNKFDDSNIDKIRNLTDEDIGKIIYDLLEWIQDINHPVAFKILPILIERQHLIISYLHKIISGNDHIWKYWILELIVPELEEKYIKELLPDIIFLAKKTPIDDDEIEVIGLAKEFEKRWKNLHLTKK